MDFAVIYKGLADMFITICGFTIRFGDYTFSVSQMFIFALAIGLIFWFLGRLAD